MALTFALMVSIVTVSSDVEQFIYVAAVKHAQRFNRPTKGFPQFSGNVPAKNVWHSFSNNLMLLMDQQDLQDELRLTVDQQQKVQALYARVSESVNYLQGLATRSGKTAGSYTCLYFDMISQTYSYKIDQALMAILSKEQQTRAHQILAQIRGPIDSFGPRWKAKMKFHEFDLTDSMRFSTSAMTEYHNNQVKAGVRKIKVENNYDLIEYVNAKIYTGFFTDEQRKIWTTCLGIPVEAERLKALKLLHIRRSSMYLDKDSRK